MDYAVIETGLGGTLDATNTVTNRNKICIITRLGLDHTEILGKTIPKIAEQKAGIIGFKNIVISQQSSATGMRIIQKRCTNKNATLNIISKKNHKIISTSSQKTEFNFSFKDIGIKNINLGLIGIHQAENCSLALTCLSILSKRDKFQVKEKKLRKTLQNISIAGRFEIKNIDKNTIIIDGAHNPQKMEAFISNLAAIYPEQKFTFIAAFKKNKDFQEMLKKMIPLADKILLTEFSTRLNNRQASVQDNTFSSIGNQKITTFLKSQKFKNFEIISNKKSEILKIINTSKKPVVITGSLYLIGSLYKYLK